MRPLKAISHRNAGAIRPAPGRSALLLIGVAIPVYNQNRSRFNGLFAPLLEFLLAVCNQFYFTRPNACKNSNTDNIMSQIAPLTEKKNAHCLRVNFCPVTFWMGLFMQVKAIPIGAKTKNRTKKRPNTMTTATRTATASRDPSVLNFFQKCVLIRRNLADRQNWTLKVQVIRVRIGIRVRCRGG